MFECGLVKHSSIDHYKLNLAAKNLRGSESIANKLLLTIDSDPEVNI